MYEDYKIYGPYLSKKDKRLRLFMRHKVTKEKRTVSYPKYLMECHLGRYLEKDETVDHIDGNPLNNDISNLQILKLSEHTKLDAIRNMDITVECAYCGRPFTIKGKDLHNRNRRDRHQSGYFCSRSCAGKYGREIQDKKRTVNPVDRVVPKKYKNKDVNNTSTNTDSSQP